MDTPKIIVDLEKVLVELEDLRAQCEKGLLTIKEVMASMGEIDIRVRSILPEGSMPWRIYDRGRRESAEWWSSTISGYVDQKDISNVGSRMQLVRKVLKELDPEFLREEAGVKIQYFFDAGESYRSKRTALKIMRKAREELAVVDEYLEEEIFDYVDSLDNNVLVKLVTGQRKRNFPKLYRDFVAIRPNVYAKVCVDCHDRFVVLDRSEVWQFGASFNGFGVKAFMMNKVVDPAEGKRFLESFEIWWSKGIDLDSG
jgi:hypothetical protein